MPRVTVSQSNFTAGEISPRLYGRSDLARYMAGAKEVTNGIVLQHGGIRRRDGTVYVANAGGSDSVRLIRYVVDRSSAYCLEFGAGYIRFFTDSGAVVDSGNNVYQISTTYAQGELDELSYTQAGDQMFIAHRNHPLARLARLAHDSWTLSDVEYVNQPVKEDIWKPKAALTLSDTTVGTGRNAWAAIFRTADYRIDANGTNVSRRIYSVGGGEAIVTGYSSGLPTSAIKHSIEITKPFESTTINPLDWWMDGQPQCALTLGYTSLAAGSSITLTYGTDNTSEGSSISYANATTYNGFPAMRVLYSSTLIPVMAVGDIVKLTDNVGRITYYDVVYAGSGEVRVVLQGSEAISAFTGGTISRYKTNPSSSANMATGADVGSIISINGGYVKVTGTSPSVYTGVIQKTLTSGVSPGANAWAIMRPAWTGDSGYPATVTCYEQRLVVSGTAFSPNTVWFSRIGNYLDFLPGSLDDDALSVTIAGSEQADIVHLMQGKALVAMASNGEYSFAGGVEKPITPTNIQIKNQSVFGCSYVRPQRIGNELYFVQRAGRKLRAFTYKYDSDDYGAPDLSIMSEHLTESGIVDMAYNPEPESILWIVRGDGDLVSVTIERENDVVAWAHHETDGDVESVCSVPSATGDTLWLCVNRNGARRIERMDSSVLLDAAVSGTSVSPTNVWSGLDHLNGKTVSVIADGVVLDDVVVSGGSVTISRDSNAVVIGLPYTTRIITLMQDFGTGTGSIHGNSNRIGEVSIRYMDTVGCKINGDYVSFRRLDTSILDDAPTTFTGLHRMELLGWERGDVSVTIEQSDPLPFHIQQVIYKFQSND